jgi:hypothetical protein
VEKECQTDESKRLFTPHEKDLGDTISTVHCLDDTDPQSKKKLNITKIKT